MPEIRVLPARTDADVRQSLDAHNAVHAPHRETLGGVRDTERQSRAFVVFNAWLDGEHAGAAHVRIPTGSEIPRGDVYVRPAYRRHGVGDALYRAVSAWAADHGASRLRASVTERDDESLGFVTRRGFEEFSRDALVLLDLTGIEEPAVAPPPGVEIVTWADRPELAPGLYDVVLEAWPDIPGSVDEVDPFDEWLRVHMQGVGDDPRATFLALAGDEVVGYAKFSLEPEDAAQAFHDLTGVKRAWRGRGIARALKQAQIAWAKREGYERLLTVNEERNEAIRHLNEQLGYRPIPGRIRLEGPISA